jgi:integrase
MTAVIPLPPCSCSGIHPKVVSEMLGHASVNITLNVYSHVLPDMQREATAAMERVLRGP